ncbi:MAG: hypothetical protein BA872_00740 [Desulfobacterales bacterium C00003060]|nr:MAG: hypothetical protein BA872_00740 [Desulfobacterales bacterium C00003060]
MCNRTGPKKRGMLVSGQDMARLRGILLKRREGIFERFQRLESDRQSLGERDVELEEGAQRADLTSPYDQLDERGYEELEEINLALCKLAMGSYGICEVCNKPISLKRMEALPATRLCQSCARKHEEEQKVLPWARQPITCATVPDQYQHLLSDELQELILEHLRNDGRVGLEDLEISFRNAVVYLEGTVPSETEHQILLKILIDVLGFLSIVDHLVTNESILEREDRVSRMPDLPLSTGGIFSEIT